MAKRVTTREAKKMKDKWKAKEWYTIIAPTMFNRTKIGETLADDPDKLMGRTIDVTLSDLTGDYKYMHIKLRFKIVDHSTSEAYTRFLGHDLTSDFIRRQTRRKRTKMEGVFDARTKDGYLVRVKPMAISDKRIQSSVQYLIRKRMNDVIMNAAGEHTFSEFIALILTSDRDRSLVSEIQKQCRKVYPLKRVDVRKVEVLDMPKGEDESRSISTDLVPLPPLPGTEEEGTDTEEEAPGPEEETDAEGAPTQPAPEEAEGEGSGTGLTEEG